MVLLRDTWTSQFTTRSRVALYKRVRISGMPVKNYDTGSRRCLGTVFLTPVRFMAADFVVVFKDYGENSRSIFMLTYMLFENCFYLFFYVKVRLRGA